MNHILKTNPEELVHYSSDHRVWQGIPSIEITKKGRIFITFYSGGVTEQIGNYSVVITSRDGVHFSQPIVAAFCENHRCFDPCLWIDPLGRLWFTWSMNPDHGLYATICEDPDAEELVWGDVFRVGRDIMMNKPVVLSSGEWLFPISVWNHNIRVLPAAFDSDEAEKGAFVYRTLDQGKTFQKLGRADWENNSFDEHMILEQSDSSLLMLIRTREGIAASRSYDKGLSWTLGENGFLPGPDARFHIRRLKSGRILLVNHVNFNGRNNLTALLSEDEGKTWSAQLLLDERQSISYPDVAEGEDGFLYIVYDRERGGYLKDLQSVYACAREILYAKITEEDILKGKLITEGSCLKCIASKLGEYKGSDPFMTKEK